MTRTRLNALGITALTGAAIAGCNLLLYSPDGHSGAGGAAGGSSTNSTSANSSSSGSTGGMGGTGGVMATGGSPGGIVAWANVYGAAGDAAAPEQVVTGIAADATGNVYVVGWFSGAIDFGAGCAANANASKQGFVVKLNEQGQCQRLLFLSAIGNDTHLTAVAVDGTGHVLVGGSFAGTITLPAQPGQSTASGASDAFIASYNADLTPSGNWSTIITGAGGETIHALTTNTLGAVYVASSFTASINVKGNNFSLPAGVAQEGFAFVLSGDDGSLQQTIPLGQAKKTDTSGISVGPKGITIVGQTDGTIDFGAGAVTAAGTDAFYVSYPTTLGVNAKPKMFGDGSTQSATAVSAGATNTYVAGVFHGALDNLVPTPPVNGGGDDVFLVNIDATAAHLVTLGVDTNQDMSVGGVAAGTDGVVMAGNMGGTNPELSIDGVLQGTFTTVGTRDIYVIKFALGLDIPVWSRTFGGVGIDYDLSALSLGPNGEIYIAGGYKGGCNLGLKTAVPGDGIFVARLEAN